MNKPHVIHTTLLIVVFLVQAVTLLYVVKMEHAMKNANEKIHEIAEVVHSVRDPIHAFGKTVEHHVGSVFDSLLEKFHLKEKDDD